MSPSMTAGVSDEFVEEVEDEDEDDLVVRDFGLTLGLDGHGEALAIRVKIEGSLTESTTNTLAAKLPPDFRRGFVYVNCGAMSGRFVLSDPL